MIIIFRIFGNLYLYLFCFRQYEKTILPKSAYTPYVILFYTDWCFSCLQTAPYFRKLMDHLEPLGVELVTIHSAKEPNLARKLNIHTIPCLVVFLEGNSYVYKETITSIRRIIGNIIVFICNTSNSIGPHI